MGWVEIFLTFSLLLQWKSYNGMKDDIDFHYVRYKLLLQRSENNENISNTAIKIAQ